MFGCCSGWDVIAGRRFQVGWSCSVKNGHCLRLHFVERFWFSQIARCVLLRCVALRSIPTEIRPARRRILSRDNIRLEITLAVLTIVYLSFPPSSLHSPILGCDINRTSFRGRYLFASATLLRPATREPRPRCPMPFFWHFFAGHEQTPNGTFFMWVSGVIIKCHSLARTSASWEVALQVCSRVPSQCGHKSAA